MTAAGHDSGGLGFCGNSIKENGEACDFGPFTVDYTMGPCSALGLGFTSGTAYCRGNCTFVDIDGCTTGSMDGGVQMDSGSACIDDGYEENDKGAVLHRRRIPESCRSDSGTG